MEVIISDRLKYVFIEVPRTASTSTREWLTRHHQGTAHNWYHSVSVPDHAKDYHTFCTVRNPVERAVSLWLWTIKQPPEQYPNLFETIGADLNEFAQTWLGEGRWRKYQHPSKIRSMFTPQTELLAGLRLDQVFQFDQIPGCFEALPFVDGVGGFGHKNAGVPEPSAPLTTASLAAIHAWDPDYVFVDKVAELLENDALRGESHGIPGSSS